MTAPERPEKRRRSGAPPAAAIIPDDLLFSEVLPRLPIKSIVRCNFVCRAWRDAIHGPDVARRHLELSSSRGTPPTMLVIPREAYHLNPMEKSCEISLYRLLLGGDARAAAPSTAAAAADVELVFEKALPAGVTHVITPAHCDGLVAIATTTGEVFVCNPATREFIALPRGTPSVRDVGGLGAPAVALGYDASRGEYVVARYFYREYKATRDANAGGVLLDHYSIGHEVFTLGGGGWEATGDPPHPIAAAATPICTREAIYWCTEHLTQNALMRFDLRSRAFDVDVVPTPPGTNTCYAMDHVTELAGKLCYTDIATDTSFDVWVADSGGRRPQWSLRCRVDLGDIALGGEAFLPVAVDGDEMLVAVDYEKVYGYDQRAKSVRQVVDLEELMYERQDGSTYEEDRGLLKHHVVPYVESLVSIRARQCSKVC